MQDKIYDHIGGYDIMSIIIQLISFAVVISAVIFFIWLERRKRKYSPFSEKFLRSPGYTLGNKVDELSHQIVTPILLVTILPMVVILKWNDLAPLSRWVVGLLTLVAVGYSIHRLWTIFKTALPTRLGYEGEVYTGQELNFLMRSGAWVYHDIPYKYGNIDHIVISTGGVFAVETKAVRKPVGEKGRTGYEVTHSRGRLFFPHVTTSQPLDQAKCHADYLSEFIRSKVGLTVRVTPVVALPGWMVKDDGSETLVINPKRGAMLRSKVQRKNISSNEAALIAERIEEFARDVNAKSDMVDPDGADKYDFFSNRKKDERRL